MPPHQRITVSLNQIQQPARLVLSAEQAHYLRRVLRLQPGSQFIAQDGQGHQWLAELTAVVDQATLLEPATLESQAGPPLTLVAALPKAGFDDVVRQVTEIGATQIQPVISQRTLLQPSDSRLKRWRRIVQEASEQSERLWVPQIYSPLSFETWVRGAPLLGETTDKASFFCVARADAPLLLTDIQRVLAADLTLPVSVVIGPEGGWLPEEIAEAEAQGHTLVSLGSAILRATTAAVAAISIVAAAREQLI
ncbi:MAG: 16S rRNA (uracil(1498)-N(3))-methyltransferase [Cyanobacteria bacterium P01_A01_bin.114]